MTKLIVAFRNFAKAHKMFANLLRYGLPVERSVKWNFHQPVFNTEVLNMRRAEAWQNLQTLKRPFGCLGALEQEVHPRIPLSHQKLRNVDTALFQHA